MIRVRVPASTANLGPGFDCFGLALNLYNHFTFEEAEEYSFSGVPEEFQNPKNLAVVAYDATVRYLGLTASALKLGINADIPVSRGLGSSASLIVAGVVAANAIHGESLSQKQMLNIATAIEGHPDNVAPALSGGLRVSMMDGSEVFSLSSLVSEKIKFCLLIPDFKLSTSLARSVLPEYVPFRDAVFNASRSAVLLKALESADYPAIRASMQDRLHQSFRYRLIEDSEVLNAVAEDLNADAFCISGAGPTLLSLYHKSDFPKRMEEAIQACKELKHRWTVLPLKIDTQGCVIEKE